MGTNAGQRQVRQRDNEKDEDAVKEEADRRGVR